MSSKSSAADAGPSITPLLYRALHRIRSTPPRIIASPATQPRRAAVALIIRIVPSPSRSPATQQRPPTLAEFFEQDWVKDPNSRAELLFLRREKQGLGAPALHEKTLGPASEAHVAFPGGRTEEGDEGGLYTAMRQTWEEIGIDLAERDYECIGQLDDREITTSLGKRLLMVLSPFVFLQLSPFAPPPDPAPATTLHWIPLASLVGGIRWSSVTVDASTRLAPRQSTALKLLIRILVGDMKFPAITLDAATPHDANGTHVPASLLDEKRAQLEGGTPPPDSRRSRAAREELKLWGLSLGMTLDLVAAMSGATPLTLPDQDDVMLSIGLVPGPGVIPPSLTSVFPRFAYPDVNFWIWVFGKRYREVVRGWEVSMRTGGTNDRRINWTGSALNTFYAAVRKALVVVIVARALGVLFGFALSGWWIFFR